MVRSAAKMQTGATSACDSARPFDPFDPETYEREVSFARKAGVAITGDGDFGLSALSDILIRVLEGDRRPVERGGRPYFRVCVQHRIRDLARETRWRETSFEQMTEDSHEGTGAESGTDPERPRACWQQDLEDVERGLLRAMQRAETGRALARAIEAQDPRTQVVVKQWLRQKIQAKALEKGSADDFETVVAEIEKAWGIDLGEFTRTEEVARALKETRDNVYVLRHRGWEKVLAEFADGRKLVAAQGSNRPARSGDVGR